MPMLKTFTNLSLKPKEILIAPHYVEAVQENPNGPGTAIHMISGEVHLVQEEPKAVCRLITAGT